MSRKNQTEQAMNICQHVKSLCNELFEHTPIAFFCFFRINVKTREFISIGTMPDFREFFMNNSHHNTDFDHRDFDKDIPSGAFFFDHVYNSPKEIQLTKSIAEQFHLGNFVGVSHRTGDYFHMFNFATPTHVHNANNFYLNNINLLDKYSNILSDPLCKVIELHKIPPIYIPSSNEIFVTDFDNMRINNFPDIVKNTLTLRDANLRQSYLSGRELEIWILLGKGFTSKEIARILHLSDRTIDNYCERLKIKLGCRRRSDLVSRYNEIFSSPTST